MNMPPVTISADSFFFMSPHRSFTTAGCFQRVTLPACGGEWIESTFQQGIASAFAAAKAAGIAAPVMVGAIPFDTQQPSALFIPEQYTPFSRTEKQQTSRYQTSWNTLKVRARQSVPEHTEFIDMITGWRCSPLSHISGTHSR